MLRGRNGLKGKRERKKEQRTMVIEEKNTHGEKNCWTTQHKSTKTCYKVTHLGYTLGLKMYIQFT